MKSWVVRNSNFVSTIVVWALLLGFASSKFPNFLSLRVFTNLFNDNAYLGIVAIGMTFVIITGGIDLSVGSMVGLSGILVAHLTLKAHLGGASAIALALMIGVGLGFVQGILISKYKLTPFLVTLGGLFFCRGVALVISQESLSISDPFAASLTRANLPLPDHANLSLLSVLWIVLTLAAVFVLRQTRFGRTVYAVGGNEASARLMGLEVEKATVLAYVASGFCAALGGVVFGLYMSSGNAIGGTGMELDAIAAVVVGGTLLTGGYGSVLGTMVGVLVLGTIQTIITFDGTLSSWWAKIAIGLLLLVFLLLQRFLNRSQHAV